MKKFRFVVKKGKLCKALSVKSKSLNGAIRKLYQMFDFDEIKEILN